jgi:4-amino-4-deoxy-L-arabinose transferase-like glycosyltransferase
MTTLAPPPLTEEHPRVSGALWILCVVFVVYALFSVPRKILELSLAEHLQGWAALASALVAAVALLLCWRFYQHIARYARDVAEVLSRVERGRWLTLVIGLGMLIRVGWVLAFPTVQTSDHATYVKLATKLIAGEAYFDGDSYSNWPPGLPFFLAGNFLLFGAKPWVIAFANLYLYAVSALLVYALARLVAGESVARVSTLLLMLWPNDFMCTGLAKKELLILPLLTASILSYIAARRAAGARGANWLYLATGCLLGAASLTQPSLMLFPSILAIYEFAQGTKMRRLVGRFGLVVIGMCVVVAPWSIRNYLVLDAFVPISTAGGEGFYSANNGLATGRYVPVYERSLDQYDEVTRSKLGFRWGLEWISEHPAEFLKLTINRQVQILGEDSDGAYWGIKVGGKTEGMAYLLAKGVSNAYWMVIMFLILAAVLARWKDRDRFPPDIVLLMQSFFYVVGIDSIFQSGSRHHMPVMGMLAVLAALTAWRKQDGTI